MEVEEGARGVTGVHAHTGEPLLCHRVGLAAALYALLAINLAFIFWKAIRGMLRVVV